MPKSAYYTMVKETEIFKALSSDTRLRIMRLLVKADMELCVCEITSILALPQYNISKGLKVLKNAGLVKEHRAGKWMMYEAVKKDKFNVLVFSALELIKCASHPMIKNDFKNLEKRIKSGLLNQCVL